MPVGNAHVTLSDTNGGAQYEAYTNANGNTQTLSLPAPDKALTLDSEYEKPAYSVWDVDVEKTGYVSSHIHGVEIVDTQTSILPVEMQPIVDEPEPEEDLHIDIPPIGLLMPDTPPVGPQFVPSLREVIIPDYITVHLGVPSNESARNVRVSFPEYIKNVTSSEIYSTWPYDALVANIHAIVTFALNRVYTEWYRGRGFNFDITNSTAYDQYFRDGAQIFDNISKIVDNIFNVYARRRGFRNPFFTAFCNGTTSTCDGLSQWGSVELANLGMSPIEILHYYYPDDLELISTDNIMGITESYPGYALSIGSEGEPVRRMQNFLNRIRVNFPLILLISNPDGVFRADTQEAVRTFQRSFNLTQDGIIGRATWNKINFIFTGVARLAELDSEGERETIGENPPNVVLLEGSRGEDVLQMQFIINFISPYYSSIPPVIQDSVFGAEDKNAVIEFQKTFGLPADGIVGPATWNKLYSVYRGIEKNVQVPPVDPSTPSYSTQYPGAPLRLGSTGPDVRAMQTFLNTIRIVYTSIPPLIVNGVFDDATRQAVVAFQNEFLLNPDGIIGPITWDYIVNYYQQVIGGAPISLEYPGAPLRIGSSGGNVRLIQGFLRELSARYPKIPLISADGIFGPLTSAAVMAFQNMFGLTPDGIVGPLTWYEIIRRRNEAV